MKTAVGIVEYCDCNCINCDIDGSDVSYTCPYCEERSTGFGINDDIHNKKLKITCEECGKKFIAQLQYEYM